MTAIASLSQSWAQNYIISIATFVLKFAAIAAIVYYGLSLFYESKKGKK
jgi:hypothetical protein